jgi:hypothetical protein
MSVDRLVILRRCRVAVLKSLERLQPCDARDLARLAEIDAEIRSLDPELRPEPGEVAFTRGELVQSVLKVVRRAKVPLSTAEITLAILAAKGISSPGTELCRRTQHKIRRPIVTLNHRGLIARQGQSRGAKWRLSEIAPPSPPR